MLAIGEWGRTFTCGFMASWLADRLSESCDCCPFQTTGVFVGSSASEYGALQTRYAKMCDAYTGTGSAMSILANRLSYQYNLMGPSMAIDSACSRCVLLSPFLLQTPAPRSRTQTQAVRQGLLALVLRTRTSIHRHARSL